MTRREELLHRSFRDVAGLARKSADALRFTHERVGGAAGIDELAATEEGRERLDTLTSRFARLADLLTQQIFRVADQIDYLDEGSLLDRLARAEKRGWIDSVETWKKIRELRNQIAHEYADEIWVGA